MISYLLSALCAGLVSIYSFSVNTINHGELNLSDYQGKKILLVNISTQSSDAAQISGLQQLYMQNLDKLVIIGFPCQDFTNENRTNEQLNAYLTDTLGITFPVAGINAVSGESAQPLYKWLANKDDNGVLNLVIKMDFEKCLIGRNGKICGVFTNEVASMDSLITNAIENDIP